jgi:xylitol oxidase
VGDLENWAGNHRYRASIVHRPRTRDELRDLLTGATGTLQVLATRHTFTGIGDADGLIALEELSGADAIAIDPAAMTVSVGPAVTYARLSAVLDAQGLALHNLASLPHISVAGGVATATHGSGDDLGNLATAVAGLTVLTAEGETAQLGREAAVHLGALGVVLQVTLDVLDAYELSQDVYLGLEWDALAENFDAIFSAGRSVSVFHRFGERAEQVWVKGDPVLGAPRELHGAVPATEPVHPVPGQDPVNCTEQLGVPGPWHERLPHFRAGFKPSAGDEIQSEFFVARADAVAALRALFGLADRIRPLLRTAELRTIAADDLWLSPHQGRDSAALHFTWYRRQGEVTAVLAEIEAALAPFAPRPHWGKLFTAPVAQLPGHAQFRALREQLDPRGVFANEWLREHRLA